MSDIFKLYDALHAEVPETRPKIDSILVPGDQFHLVLWDDGRWYWLLNNDKANFTKDNRVDDSRVSLVCYRAMLEWACSGLNSNGDDFVRPRYLPIADKLENWLIGRAKDNAHLIDICRAIHMTKGTTI